MSNKSNVQSSDYCDMEKAFKEGRIPKCSPSENSLPKLSEGMKKGVPSPLLEAFRLEKKKQINSEHQHRAASTPL